MPNGKTKQIEIMEIQPRLAFQNNFIDHENIQIHFLSKCKIKKAEDEIEQNNGNKWHKVMELCPTPTTKHIESGKIQSDDPALSLQIEPFNHSNQKGNLVKENIIDPKKLRIQITWIDIVVVPNEDIKKGCFQKQVGVGVGGEIRKILNHVSGTAQPQQFLAIMGASGN